MIIGGDDDGALAMCIWMTRWLKLSGQMNATVAVLEFA